MFSLCVFRIWRSSVATTVQLALLAGLSYGFSVRKWIIAPVVRYRFPLTSWQGATGLKASGVQAGVQVRHALAVF